MYIEFHTLYPERIRSLNSLTVCMLHKKIYFMVKINIYKINIFLFIIMYKKSSKQCLSPNISPILCLIKDHVNPHTFGSTSFFK